MVRDDFFYTVGREVRIRHHQPSPPTKKNFVLHKLPAGESARIEEERATLSLAERCIQHPPLSEDSTGSQTFTLRIAQQSCAGKGRSAQIVLVEAKGLKIDRLVVAKFYDPLYDKSFSGDLVDYPSCPFRYADYGYSHECAMYQKLQALKLETSPSFTALSHARFPQMLMVLGLAFCDSF